MFVVYCGLMPFSTKIEWQGQIVVPLSILPSFRIQFLLFISAIYGHFSIEILYEYASREYSRQIVKIWNCFQDISNTEEVDELKYKLGVCPQHNILYDILTAEEHLKIYGTIKGIEAQDMERQVCKGGAESVSTA